MIFKYLTYNKPTKSWQDTNKYCSLCTDLGASYNGKFITSIYNKLIDNKLITFPLNNFHFSNDTENDLQLTYRISYMQNDKRNSVGKLVQLIKPENKPALFAKRGLSGMKYSNNKTYVPANWGTFDGYTTTINSSGNYFVTTATASSSTATSTINYDFVVR